MPISSGSGAKKAGPTDIICILKLPAGTFHVTFLEEHPFPGQKEPKKEPDIIRLRSKIFHEQGAATIEGAKQQISEFRKKILLPDGNIVVDRAIKVSDPDPVWLLPNWIKFGFRLEEALAKVIY